MTDDDVHSTDTGDTEAPHLLYYLHYVQRKSIAKYVVKYSMGIIQNLIKENCIIFGVTIVPVVVVSLNILWERDNYTQQIIPFFTSTLFTQMAEYVQICSGLKGNQYSLSF